MKVRRMVEIARTVDPRMEVAVRTHSEEEAALLEKENAGKIFLRQHELARSMIRFGSAATPPLARIIETARWAFMSRPRSDLPRHGAWR